MTLNRLLILKNTRRYLRTTSKTTKKTIEVLNNIILRD